MTIHTRCYPRLKNVENFPWLGPLNLQSVKYDVLLKSILRSAGSRFIEDLTGSSPVEQLNPEFSSVERRVPDLVTRLANGRIFHLEIQNDNCPTMPSRMLHYWVLLAKQYPAELIDQMVIYFGSAAMRMETGFDLQSLRYSYPVLSIRDWDGSRLLASPHPDDRMLALLCRNSVSPSELLRLIGQSWRGLPRDRLVNLLEKLVVLSGMRGLEDTVQEALPHMAINVEKLIEENKFFRDWKARGLAEGLQEGRQQGRQQGRQEGLIEGETSVLLRMLHRRFGPLPQTTVEQIRAASPEMIDRWIDRVLDAPTLDAVLEQ